MRLIRHFSVITMAVLLAACAPARTSEVPVSESIETDETALAPQSMFARWQQSPDDFDVAVEGEMAIADGESVTVLGLTFAPAGDEDWTDIVVASGPSTKPIAETPLSRIPPSGAAHPIYAYYHEIVLMTSDVFGEWNGYFYVHDHNGNGRDEAIAMQLAGSHFVPVIYEYHDGEFKSVMPHSERGTVTLGWEAPARGLINVYERDQAGVLQRFEYAWNDDAAVYELLGTVAFSSAEEAELGLPSYEPE